MICHISSRNKPEEYGIFKGYSGYGGTIGYASPLQLHWPWFTSSSASRDVLACCIAVLGASTSSECGLEPLSPTATCSPQAVPQPEVGNCLRLLLKTKGSQNDIWGQLNSETCSFLIPAVLPGNIRHSWKQVHRGLRKPSQTAPDTEPRLSPVVEVVTNPYGPLGIPLLHVCTIHEFVPPPFSTSGCVKHCYG